jgi:hypothetical protein
MAATATAPQEGGALWIVFRRNENDIDRDLALDANEAGRLACFAISRHPRCGPAMRCG